MFYPSDASRLLLRPFETSTGSCQTARQLPCALTGNWCLQLVWLNGTVVTECWQRAKMRTRCKENENKVQRTCLLWGLYNIHWRSQAILESREEGVTQANTIESIRRDVLWEVGWFGKAGWGITVFEPQRSTWSSWLVRFSGRLLSAAVGLLAPEMWCSFLAHPAGYSPWCKSRAKPGLVLLNNAWWEISASPSPTHIRRVVAVVKKLWEPQGRWRFGLSLRLAESFWRDSLSNKMWEEAKVVVVKSCGHMGA